MAIENPFVNLYSYTASGGVRIPDTNTIKSYVENTMRQIFGADFDMTPETPMGRFVEAITLFIVNVLGVNAQAAGCVSPDSSVGEQLDALGKMFGVNRLPGQSDASYRKTLVSAQSRGSGFTESISQAITSLDVMRAVVLENGYDRPVEKSGISVAPHSIFVCVNGGSATDADIADAILSSKSAGCGYTNLGGDGSVTVGDVIFHRAVQKHITVYRSVTNVSYTGEDIDEDVNVAINSYLNAESMGGNIAATTLASHIALAVPGVILNTVYFMRDGDAKKYDRVQTNANEIISATIETL